MSLGELIATQVNVMNYFRLVDSLENDHDLWTARALGLILETIRTAMKSLNCEFGTNSEYGALNR